MMPFPLLSRLRQRESAASGMASGLHSRTEVTPPSLRQAPSSLPRRLWFWLLAPAPLQAAPPLNRLPPVRQAFLHVLLDLPCGPSQSLAQRISHAHSLRELWHLRAEVYHLVAVHHSQSEAEGRLQALNRHFPTRTPRGSLATQYS